MALLHEKVTRVAIGRFFCVYNRLGHGLLEAAYAGALEIELRKTGLKVAREFPVAIAYDGIILGNYRADLLLDSSVVIEVKATAAIADDHLRQLRNYLKCSSLEVGLLFNFGPRPEFRRMILTNDRKPDRVTDSTPFPED